MSYKKVLFISHDALRTGAPIILLDFLKWFKNHSEIPFQILLRKGGELEPEFQALAPVSVFDEKQFLGNRWYKRAVLVPGFQRFINLGHFNRLKRELIHEDIGLIYSNTITNGEVLKFLSDLKCPVITHVHELEYWIGRMGPNNRAAYDPRLKSLQGNCFLRTPTDRFVAVKKCVSIDTISDIPLRRWVCVSAS